jgi:hypothetical protein
VLSVKAGGTGLNLTAASHVFHFDRWWNPAVEDQATDRAYRIGQKRAVHVYKMVCVGTVEEKIDSMLEHKRDLAKKVVGAGEQWITELDGRELRDLFSLSQGAVAEGEDAAPPILSTDLATSGAFRQSIHWRCTLVTGQCRSSFSCIRRKAATSRRTCRTTHRCSMFVMRYRTKSKSK